MERDSDQSSPDDTYLMKTEDIERERRLEELQRKKRQLEIRHERVKMH
jgi:hypothetical protein